jgi:hypothetical protein
MGTQITVIQSDYGYSLAFTLQDSQGNVFNLTNVTSLLFRTQRVGNSDINSSGTMNVDAPLLGTCYYVVAQSDFTIAGVYNVQIQANLSGEIITWSNISLEVIPKVPF